ncbi:MAG TPA: alpha/beta hydrolase [Pyrinomonadaceae bacterium]|nr:alpha/beta hydrolase [Pyrinomonadaceae bacterium]
MKDINSSGNDGRVRKLPACATGLTVVVIVVAVIGSTVAYQTAPAVQATSATSQTIDLKPCTVENVEGKVLCGTHEVFENRATRKGRKISLKIVVFAATGSNPQPDPFVYIPGGPGSSATEDAPYLAKTFARIREQRDLLFVDQRGTGGSNPLNCKLFNEADPQSFLGYFFPLAEVRKCREELEPKADLKLYTTSIAMDDLDEVRAALGYKQLNLYGASYGTRAALVYLRQHDPSVRTVTLFGVSPTNQFMPRIFPQDTERALQGVLAECVSDAECSKAFPNVQAEAKLVLERLLKGPVEVELTRESKPAPPTKFKVRLSRDLVAEAIRYMLYNPAAALRIPLFLHLAAQNNFVPFARAALDYRRGIVASGSNGLYLSVTCAEDLPWVKADEASQLAANTFLGDYRYRQQSEACALWPRADIPADYSKPVTSNVPVVIFTGEWDPVTPPANAAGVARHLPKSLNIVIPHGGHGFNGLEGTDCIDRLQSEFVSKGTTEGLNTDCVKAIKRKPWVLEMK